MGGSEHQSGSRVIEYVAVASLRPYPGNARKHDANQLDDIAKSVRTFGFTNPVIIDEADMLLAGHGRWEAVRTRVPEMSSVPCIRLVDLSEAMKKAYVLADNKIALNATWDENVLAREVANLRALEDVGEIDFDLGVIAFSASEMAELDRLLVAEDPPEEAREAVLEPEPAVCQRGETWCLGNHRLAVGGGEVARDADVIIRMWERETKEEATLGGKEGQTFKAVAEARGIKFERPASRTQRAKHKAG